MLEICSRHLLLLLDLLIFQELARRKYLVYGISNFLLFKRLIHIVVQSMVKTLMIPARLYIYQKCLIQSEFGF